MPMASVVLLFCLFIVCSAVQNEGPMLTSSNNTVVNATVGNEVKLACALDVGTNDIIWYFNNAPLTRGRVDKQGGTLTLSSLQLTHSGWYTCVTDNHFGRHERDFLLVVGMRSTPFITFNESVAYQTPVGSRVELPCHFTGVPQPTIQWFEGNGTLITGNDGRYTIDNVTKSLIMLGPSQEQTLTFYCEASNMFDESPQRSNVTVEFFNAGQLDVSFPINNLPLESMVISVDGGTLRCTTLSDLTNYTVMWTRNFDPATDVAQENVMSVRDSGYYCCQVSGQQLRRSLFCITVVNTNASFPRLNTTTSVSLPANRGRTVNLICVGDTLNNFAPPTIELQSLNESLVWSESGLFSGVSYLVDVNGTATTYTCSGSNIAGNVSTDIQVDSIAVCQGENALIGGNANLSHIDRWSGSLTDVRMDSVQGEWVFVLDYNATTIPRFYQTVDIPDGTLSIDVSGRVRQEGSSNFRAAVLLVSDDMNITSTCRYLTNPYPTLRSWQWIGCSVAPTTTSNVTIVMTVVSEGAESQSGSGTAYFDDLCVSFAVKDTAGGGGLSDFHKYLIIGASGACGVLAILICMVLCCFCCCCGKRKGNAKMMKKMSTLIRNKRPSTVTHDLQRTDGRYKPQALQPIAEIEMYTTADSQAQDSYVNPDNYAICHEHRPVKVPPVKIKQSTGVPIPSPSNNSSSETNEVYTSLKREDLDQTNLYMTPSNCSTSSLHKLMETESENRQYANVDGGTSAKYLTLVSPNSHKNEELMKASASVSSRSPSPSYPPPLPPVRHGAKENSRRADSSPTAPTPFRRTSTDAMRPTSPLVSASTREPPEQQIYENGPEILSSPSSVTNGAPRTISSGRLLPGISVSPPPVSSQAHNQQIYENNQEFFVMEDSDEDDGYENDLPGLHQ